MQDQLTTAAQVFAALGDVKGVAAIVGAKRTAAANWKSAGRFPSRTYLAISTELQRRGLDAPASLWGMAETRGLAGPGAAPTVATGMG